MYEVAKKVKVVALVLGVVSLVMGSILLATRPIKLARDNRIQTLPPQDVMQITRNRVNLAREYPFFGLVVPSNLQQYPAKALAQMKQDLQTLATAKDPTVRQQADASLRHHSQLVFETVEGQIRKAQNASGMIAVGLLLVATAVIFLFVGWLRVMFGCLVVGLFCVCLPIKDQWMVALLIFYAPAGAGLIVTWLVRDNPARPAIPYNTLEEHF